MGGDDAEKLSSSHHHCRRSGIPFPIGSSVEVRTDEVGLKGAYFSATVISAGKTSEKPYVEYHDLLARKGRSDRLQEHLDAAFVRPTPPLEQHIKGFEADDVVDAYYKDGWWEGGERFVVRFESPPVELEYGVDELRAHWEWDNGKWVKPPGNKAGGGGLMFDVGREVELCLDTEKLEDAWFPATIQQDSGDGAFMVEYTRSEKKGKTKVVASSVFLRPCPPLLMNQKKFILPGKEVDAFFDFGWWSGVATKELENGRYVVFLKQMNLDKEFNLSELRPHMEFKDGKWWLLSSDDDGLVHENHNNTADNQNMTTKRRRRQRNLSDDSETAVMKKKLQELGNVEGANQQQDEGEHDKLIEQVSCKTRIPKSIHSKRVTRNIKRTLPRVLDEEKGENHSSDREERRTMSEKIAVQVQEDSLKGKTMEIDHTVEKVVNEEVASNEFDDDEWIEETEENEDSGRKTSNESQILPCVVNKIDKTVGVVQASSALVDEGLMVPGEPQGSSCASLWKTIESMEVFQRMPQRPHLQPLEHLNEILREGLAIGLMATFACLVEKISRLQLNDEKGIMDDITETLTVLENHGFDVSIVRGSVTNLIGLKDKGEKLVDEVNNIRNQILESNHEKARIERDIREINEQISKFKEKLSLAESAKQKEDEEIASLQARLKETEENIKNVLYGFDGCCEI